MKEPLYILKPSTDIPHFDPEMVYVECRNCGQPLIWEPGRTTALLSGAGLDVDNLDASYLIVAENCPLCKPEDNEFSLNVIRLPKQNSLDYHHIRELLESVETEIATDIGSANFFRLKPPFGNA